MRTDLTSCSWLTGLTVTPAFANVVAEYVPQGTPGAQTSTLIAGLVKSDSDEMCFGLPARTAISSSFCANKTGAPAANPPLTTFCMLATSAEAKTSAGAPCSICMTSIGLPAKLNLTSTPGYRAWTWSPIFVNAPVSDAAASTVRLPETSGVGPAGWAARPPQAAVTSAAATDIRMNGRLGNVAPPLLSGSLLDHDVVGLEHGRGDI